MSCSRSSRTLLLALAATFAAVLSGCATSIGSGSGSTTPIALKAGQIGGMLHGGNQPVTGATMTLWAAGAPTTGGGYGAGATLVSTTLSLADGSFNFNVAGASPCTTGQYLYITSTGGNAGAGVNTYAAMMAALPSPCSSSTAGTFVWVNEVTTVAAVWSLQQFMTISPSGVIKWQIGAPSTNITGLANAFTQTAQLASIANGTSAVSSVASLVSSVAYTTTITPDISRIDTLADILAACVNTTGTSACTSLFADTTPGSSTAPTDTIQVAYYLATNPGGLTMPAHSAANSPTYLCTQYVVPSPAFLPTLTCGTNTNDWLVGVSWATIVTGGSACGAGGTCIGTTDAASIAIDQTGNIWVGAGTGVAAGGAMITEFNQSGQEILSPVGSVAIPAYNVNFIAVSTANLLAYAGTTSISVGYGRPTTSIAIDTNNNAWFDSYGATSPGTIGSTVTMPTGLLVKVAPGGTASGFIAPAANGVLAIDGFNNIYQSGQPISGKSYITEIESGAQTGETGVAYQTIDEGSERNGSGNINNSVFVDSNEYAWGLNGTQTCGTTGTPLSLDRTTTAEQESNPVSGNATSSVTDAVGCAFYGAPDASGNAWATASGNLYYINTSASTTSAPAATITTITGSTNTSTTTASTGAGGLDNPTGVALDGVGNVWVANRLSSTTVGGISEFSVSTNTATPPVTTATTLSPGGLAGEFGFNDFNALAAQGIVIDGSGNLWLETTGGNALWHIVGAAAPVVTPIALAIKNGTLATRP